MHDHREILALAAAAIDFELDVDERRMLAEGLETCSQCRRQVAAIRATATVLRRPIDLGTPGRVRDVVVGAALGQRNRGPAVRSLLAASLTIAVLGAGAVAFVGSRGLGLVPTPSASPIAAAPSPTLETIAPTSVPSPTTPIATASVAPEPSPVPAGPLGPGDVAAMVTDGRLVIRTLPATGPNSALFKTRLYPGQRALVLEGPVSGDGYVWYRIRVGAIEGWASGADRDGTPWLSPVASGPIAFVSEASVGAREAIHLIDADDPGTDRVLLADPAISQYSQLSWSPDGRRLAFVGTPVEPIDAAPEVFVVDADGSNLVRLTTDEWHDDCPVWSPDGKRLAFRQEPVDPGLIERAAGPSVVVVNADGTSTAVLGAGECPAWSPDSQQLAMVVADRSDPAAGIWIQAADGSGRRLLTPEAMASTALDWSPDGLQLVASVAGPSPDAAGLSLLDVETGKVTLLVHGPTASPSWSTRGQIAFSSSTEATSPGIYIVDADGQGRTRMTSDAVGVPEWSPDGRLLLVGAETSGELAVKDPVSGDGKVTVLVVGRSPAWQPRLP